MNNREINFFIIFHNFIVPDIATVFLTDVFKIACLHTDDVKVFTIKALLKRFLCFSRFLKMAKRVLIHVIFNGFNDCGKTIYKVITS